MVGFFLVFSVIFCILSFINMDPMKSSFFLILTLISSMPLVSFMNHIWYSYFICLLFLSGIFVIIVYFSSLSKINFVKSKMVFFPFVLTLFFSIIFLIDFNNSLNLSSFYYEVFLFQLLFIIFFLLIFMNFSSYFLNFSGALRKI